MKKILVLFVFGLAMSAFVAMAQDDGKPRHAGGAGGGAGGDGKRPMPPVMAALDANGDGVIDEKEIANASAALKKLDKNGDGKLTMDEIRPQRPAGAPGGGRKPEGDKKPEAPKKADDIDLNAPAGK
ncbi:MAG TPA: hypothetical protein DET40_07495 [Lentisphaeria bacterium]|nr:MAG: hypothetical protein A2X45_06800 [Lentisphaerae bacterium GWF2_50_93]HCE43376.1 hypothetical protein [Lentisphaeria bacterium]